MRFPKPPYTPPQWYWRLPLRWRQRYCRWVIWKWEAAYRFFTNILSRDFLCDGFPRFVSFSLYCLRHDRLDGISLRDTIGYLSSYTRDCWRAWYHRMPGSRVPS